MVTPYVELLELVEEVFGATGRQVLDQLCRARLQGLRLSIPATYRLDAELVAEVVAEAPTVAAAAAKLGAHRSTIYRLLERRRLIR